MSVKKTSNQLKKLLLYSISISIITIGTILGCADGWGPEDGIRSFFAPEVSRSAQQPYFRSFHLLYNSTGEHYTNVSLFNRINVSEWSAFFPGADTNDLAFLLYTAKLSAIDSLIFHLKDPSRPLKKPLSSNSILKQAEKDKVNDFLFYLGFAKRCEKVAAVEKYWYWEEKDQNKIGDKELKQLIDNGMKAMQRQKNPFIKDRYIFQLARLLYFNNTYEESVAFVNMHKLNDDQSSMYHRTEGYKAASLYKLKRYAEANLVYARHFMMNEPFRTVGYMSFHPVSESDLSQTLNMASTSKEKEAIWCLMGIYHDGLRAMREIMKIDPASEYLELLLVREVRYQEELQSRFKPQDYDPVDMTSIAPKVSGLDELLAFTGEAVSFIPKEKKYLWVLASGYLNMIKGDLNVMESSLVKAMKLAEGDRTAQAQIRLIRLIADVESFKPGNSRSGEHIAKELEWCKAGADGFYSFQVKNVIQYCHEQLSKKFKEAGEQNLAECFRPDPGKFYTSNPAIRNMVSFIDKPSKSQLEKYALAVYPYSKANLLELNAIRLVYSGDLDGALQIFENYPPSGEVMLPGDPFIIHINDCHDCDHQARQDVKYSKHQFLAKVVELEKKVSSGSEIAKNSFLLANAYYNISYYGNARMFYNNYVTYEVFVDFTYSMPIEKDPVFSCEKAERYYMQSMNASADQEHQAKCCFMAAKCEQNEFFNTRTSDVSDDFRAGRYFEKLRSDLASTAYYKEVIRECGYFRTYINTEK